VGRSFHFSMTMLHRRCAFAALCAFSMFSLVYVLAEMHHPAYPGRPSTQVVVTQSVEGTIPVIDGYWDLVLKGSTKQLQKVKICVRQNGTRLVIRSKGGQSMRMKKNSSTFGLVTSDRISFALTPRDSEKVVFTGKLENGIICGMTDTGLPWMAISIDPMCCMIAIQEGCSRRLLAEFDPFSLKLPTAKASDEI
jgi:hypothetical protein